VHQTGARPWTDGARVHHFPRRLESAALRRKLSCGAALINTASSRCAVRSAEDPEAPATAQAGQLPTAGPVRPR
jgi:hypothetical protein